MGIFPTYVLAEVGLRWPCEYLKLNASLLGGSFQSSALCWIHLERKKLGNKTLQIANLELSSSRRGLRDLSTLSSSCVSVSTSVGCGFTVCRFCSTRYEHLHRPRTDRYCLFDSPTDLQNRQDQIHRMAKMAAQAGLVDGSRQRRSHGQSPSFRPQQTRFRILLA